MEEHIPCYDEGYDLEDIDEYEAIFDDMAAAVTS